MTEGYGAIVLAGGAGRRLGGVDKPAVAVAGRSMLARVLAAVADARPRVVVGPTRADLPVDVVGTREQPPGGGPVAALAAGLTAIRPTPGVVAVLAADLPYLTGATIAALRLELSRSTVDGVVLVDDAGRPQLLCGAWRADALAARLAALGEASGASMRSLVGPMSVATVAVSADGDGPPPWYDCDTEDDLRRAREWLTHG